jgi:probable F420-dependent oxidoreductase
VVRPFAAELVEAEVPDAAEDGGDAAAGPADGVLDLREGTGDAGNACELLEQGAHEVAAAVVEALDGVGVGHHVLGRVLHHAAMDLGRIGIWASAQRMGGREYLPEGARVAEGLGYGTFWLGGSPPARALRSLLEATSTMVVATGILNVWQHTPQEAASEFGALDSERALLGVGIGHPEATSDYKRPLKTMRDFFDGLDAVPRDRRITAALGPKMLALAKERSLGTHPYFTTPDHTRFARETVGPNAIVAPELACVIDPDPETGRATAREYAALYLNLRNYTQNLLNFGFTESDIADGGSDRLIDAVVPHGSADQVNEHITAHFEAGADHVCVQVLGAPGIPRQDWERLADIAMR